MKLHFDDLQKPRGLQTAAQQSVLWVPSSALVVHELQVPKAPKRKWPELIPWMLEEKLLQAPELSHFVVCGVQDAQLTVLVVARQQMQLWQEAVAKAGIDDFALVPDFMALPWRSGQISLAKRGDQILVRNGQNKGFAAPSEFAWYMLQQLLEKSDKPLSLAIAFPQEELPETLQSRVERTLANIDWQSASVPVGMDLLSGEFRRVKQSALSRRWIASAALVLLTLGLAYLSLDLENKALARQVETLAEQNRTEFFRLFPGLSIRSGDIRTTLEAFISGRFKQGESLNSQSIRALLAADRALSSCNCGLQSLQWTQDGLELNMPLAAAENVERWQIDAYQKQISAEPENGLSVVLRPESD